MSDAAGNIDTLAKYFVDGICKVKALHVFCWRKTAQELSPRRRLLQTWCLASTPSCPHQTQTAAVMWSRSWAERRPWVHSAGWQKQHWLCCHRLVTRTTLAAMSTLVVMYRGDIASFTVCLTDVPSAHLLLLGISRPGAGRRRPFRRPIGRRRAADELTLGWGRAVRRGRQRSTSAPVAVIAVIGHRQRALRCLARRLLVGVVLVDDGLRVTGLQARRQVCELLQQSQREAPHVSRLTACHTESNEPLPPD